MESTDPSSFRGPKMVPLLCAVYAQPSLKGRENLDSFQLTAFSMPAVKHSPSRFSVGDRFCLSAMWASSVSCGPIAAADVAILAIGPIWSGLRSSQPAATRQLFQSKMSSVGQTKGRAL